MKRIRKISTNKSSTVPSRSHDPDVELHKEEDKQNAFIFSHKNDRLLTRKEVHLAYRKKHYF